MKIKIYPRFLIIFLLIAILPVLGLTIINIRKGNRIIVEEMEKNLVHRGTDIAKRVQLLLEMCANDLNLLKKLPRNLKTYLDFSDAKKSEIWRQVGTNSDSISLKKEVPLYREIAFIGADGREQVRIDNILDSGSIAQKDYKVVTQIVPPGLLRNVSDPKQTLFKMEDYFLKAKGLPPGELYVGELTGWYVTPEEQLRGAKYPEDAVEGKKYEGVIRFAAPVFGENGTLEGVVVLALDHAHLQEIAVHIHPLEDKLYVISPYSRGNYAYLFDHKGWIIAHQKLWDIRGVDTKGKPVPPFTKVEGPNDGPVNLVQGPPGKDELDPLFLKMMDHLQAGMGDIIHSPNYGLKNLEPVIQAQGYAPIFFDRGPYKESGIFGGVMMTAKRSTVHMLAQNMTSYFVWLFAGILSLIVPLAVWLARSVTDPVNRLNQAARSIAQGNLEHQVPALGNDEIGELGQIFNKMAASLKEKIFQLEEKKKKEKVHLQSRIDHLEKELQESRVGGLVLESPVMKALMENVENVARTDATILIEGERGTGKERVAAAIHQLSPRKNGPYLRLNCAAIASNLIESELFGHSRGAFTGAHGEKRGFFEAASGGTLLLDEISEMGVDLQAKLLRVLQEKEITRVGETTPRGMDARLIFATNRNLQHLVSLGKFRADLYDRLNVVSLRVPSLRERTEDIIPLAGHFLRLANMRYNKSFIGFSEETVEVLLRHSWPGNVRELQNAIERAVIQSKGQYIETPDLALDQSVDTLGLNWNIPDMTVEELKVRYSQYVRSKYPDYPLKRVKDILGIDWNTLRKYLR